MLQRLITLLRHRWLDESDTRRLLKPETIDQLTRRVGASERRHTGEIRIVVEAGLPLSYLWRHCRDKVGMAALTRERASTLFGKLRVWDTANNNGVLIYLLLAERTIELLADRGVNAFVSAAEWDAMVRRMGLAFAGGRYEDGLTQALEEVSAVLVANFPADAAAANPNELPDGPQVG